MLVDVNEGFLMALGISKLAGSLRREIAVELAPNVAKDLTGRGMVAFRRNEGIYFAGIEGESIVFHGPYPDPMDE